MLELKPDADLRSIVIHAIDHLESQATWCEELSDLASRQAEVIESGDVERLLGLLQRRQEIIDGLIQSQEDLVPIITRLMDEEESIEPGLHGRLGRLIDRVRETLALVMETDERDQNALETRLRSVGKELEETKAVRSAHRAYMKPATTASPRFTDRKG